MFTNILLPVDGSLSMTPLVHKCLAFAAGIGAAVVAVHVADSAASPGHAARILEDVAGAARTLGVPCTSHVLAGAEPWQAILAAADAHDADLICMGSHGRHGATEHVLASQALRVLEQARLPVLLFR
jgi:nucleotide-binding universal stress UspA family protein